MPNSIDLSSFESFLSSISPLINLDPPAKIATIQERMAALPKEKHYEIYGFFQRKNEINFVNRSNGKPIPVMANNYLEICELLMKPHVYLELRDPSLQFLPSQTLIAEAIKKTSEAITESAELIPELAKISAEYSFDVTEKDMRRALTQHGVFNDKKSAPLSKSPLASISDSHPNPISKPKPPS